MTSRRNLQSGRRKSTLLISAHPPSGTRRNRKRRSNFRRRHSISPQFDVRRLLTPRIDKRGRVLKRFERRRAASIERLHRIRRLRSSNDPAAHVLADVLEGCGPEKRCHSLACPECGRLRRVYGSAPILQFLANYPLPTLRCLTLINAAHALPAGDLDRFDPAKFLTALRRQLERRSEINKSNSFIIAYLDGEWDEGWQVYQPHLHAIVYGVTKSDLKRLIKRWPKHKRVRVRARLEPIDDLPRVVAYLDKTYWPCVARKNNPLNIPAHRKHRPPVKIELEILNWTHAHKHQELKLLFGVKLYGNILVKL